MVPLGRDEKRAAVDAVPFWYHSIDVGDGIVTPGKWSLPRLRARFKQFALPDLADLTVIDIGCWDGWNAFEAERRGARRVVAMDRHVWINPRLPGKAGFDAAHLCLQSNVEQRVADLRTVELEEVGSFDIALFIGVLYHLTDPYAALRRLAMITRRLAVIETVGIDIPEVAHSAYFEFFGSDELAGDQTNWWAPNDRALVDMCRSAGFADARIVVTNHGRTAMKAGKPDYVRYIAHAWH